MAEAAGARYQGKALISEHRRGECDYLRITRPADVGPGETWPVGILNGPATEDGLTGFVEQVHSQFAAADAQVPSELVYMAPAAPVTLVARARREGVRLRSFIEYQGLLDLRPLAESPARHDRLAIASTRPNFYVAAAVHHRGWRRSGRGAEGLIGQVSIPWLSARSPRLIMVLGDFGRERPRSSRQLDPPLPAEFPARPAVLVELRPLEKAPTLDQLLRRAPGPSGRGRSPWEAPLHDPHGRLALLFDGFDELELRVGYDNAADYLQTLLTRSTGRAKVVLTSRTQHFRSTEQIQTALGDKVATVYRKPGHDAWRTSPTTRSVSTWPTSTGDEVRAQARLPPPR